MQVSINLDNKNVCEKCSVKDLNEWSKPSDFPVINQEFSGCKNNYVYAATCSGSRQELPHFPFDTVLKLNTSNKSIQTWSTTRRRFIGEPIFVPKGNAQEEDDGYLLVVEVNNHYFFHFFIYFKLHVAFKMSRLLIIFLFNLKKFLFLRNYPKNNF